MLGGGRLSLSIGGDPQVLKKVRPVLAAFGDPLVHMGGLGSGMAGKLARNLLHYSTAAVDLEAARLALAAGVDPEAFIAFVRAADAKAPARMHYLTVGEDRTPLAPSLPAVGYALKDLAAAETLAGDVGETLGIGAAVRSVFIAAEARTVPPDGTSVTGS
jgi:3-hydroxyisobutyrate dehydrogenase-like beta-hydroxyacid dehydrogenase